MIRFSFLVFRLNFSESTEYMESKILFLTLGKAKEIQFLISLEIDKINFALLYERFSFLKSFVGKRLYPFKAKIA